MRKLVAVAVLVAALASGCTVVSVDVRLIVRNRSDYALVELYVAHIGSPTWGPNLLRGEVLLPGETIRVHNFDCGLYDILVVDETDVECILDRVDLCTNDVIWAVTNQTLDRCAAGGGAVPAAAGRAVDPVSG